MGIQPTSIGEDDGTLTVCVRVNGEDTTTCPIGFDFIVMLSTLDGSAGDMFGILLRINDHNCFLLQS